VVLDSEVQHRAVVDLVDEVQAGDLVVLNETRVRQARLHVHRPKSADGGGGARVELLFLHPLGGTDWAALGKANRPLRVGDELEAQDLSLRVKSRGSDGTLVLEVHGELESVLLRDGSMPIPPYMERIADDEDIERYQTVFSNELGSAAAPTAGLHLTEDMISRMKAKGVRFAQVILHVGIGTFRPVKADDLDEHPMHSEDVEVGTLAAEEIAEARKRGGRVIAIGTTVVRALESCADSTQLGQVLAQKKSTNLLIQPGSELRVVDALWTNFHQPRSTLLALVSAFVGQERLMKVYAEAVSESYRFLSYGDAMWIPKRLTS